MDEAEPSKPLIPSVERDSSVETKPSVETEPSDPSTPRPEGYLKLYQGTKPDYLDTVLELFDRHKHPFILVEECALTWMGATVRMGQVRRNCWCHFSAHLNSFDDRTVMFLCEHASYATSLGIFYRRADGYRSSTQPGRKRS